MDFKTKKNIDGLRIKREHIEKVVDYPLAKFVLRNKKNSVWYSKHGQTKKFTTNSSKLYFDQRTLSLLRKGESVWSPALRIDSALSRKKEANLIYHVERKLDLYEILKERYQHAGNYFSDLLRGSVEGVSMVRMWNVSIVASVIFGMFLMTMVYRYLGQGVQAKNKEVKGASVENSGILKKSQEELDKEREKSEELIAQMLQRQAEEKEEQRIENIKEMVKGYPIENMVPYILKKDKTVAAFLIGIAKKESSWGERVPVLNGKDCYNYWGYRGKRARMGTGGHTCFDSPQDAVDTVAKRLEFLVKDEKADTPKEMVTIWKCGYDCSWDDPKAVKKWVSDVDMYFDKFNQIDKE